MSDENVGGLVLLPCPGCGGDRTRIIGGPGTKGGPKFWAGCDLCRWRTWGNTEEDAILSWNTRVSAHGQPVVDADIRLRQHKDGSWSVRIGEGAIPNGYATAYDALRAALGATP